MGGKRRGWEVGSLRVWEFRGLSRGLFAHVVPSNRPMVGLENTICWKFYGKLSLFTSMMARMAYCSPNALNCPVALNPALVKVFVYHGSDDRLIATTQEPKAFGVISRETLRCVSVTPRGAFSLIWDGEDILCQLRSSWCGWYRRENTL